MTTSPPGSVPIVRLDGLLNERGIESIAPVLASSLSEWLADQRWFGDKTRTIADIDVADTAIEPGPHGFWLSLLLNLTFTDGARSRYFVPLAVSPALPADSAPLALLNATDHTAAMIDALALPEYRATLLDRLQSNHSTTSAKGILVWQATPGQLATVAAAARAPSQVSAAEQSNTSIVFGDALILKMFRKIQPGINPEIEIGRFLTTKTSFRQMPALIGVLTYIPKSGESASLAVAQSFIPNQSDGWSYTLRSIEQALSAAARGERANTLVDAYSDAAELLGRRTGQLHVALARSAAEPSFQPEPISQSDISSWRQTTLQSLHETAAAIVARMPYVDPQSTQVLVRFQAAVAQLETWGDGYQALSGTTKIRVHGDYHLGQTVRTTDNDFVILDFEGEPARSLAERRAKTSALKDVAGMLRSFTYARGAAAHAFSAAAAPPELADWLAEWERQARNAFIAGYRAETSEQDVPFLPASRADFDIALAAWELDKALYEIRYELNNRPDWLPIALTGLV